MNENLLRVLVTDSYLDNSKGMSKFELVYTQQTNNRVENNKDINCEVNFVVNALKKYGIDAKVAGSFRRNNLYLDELTFIVVADSRRNVVKQCSEALDFENINRDRASRVVKINNYYLFEMFIFVNEKDYIPALIKYTGSYDFYKLYKAKIEEKGLFKINGESEQDIFNQLGIPYLQPELRECVDDLSIPYASFIINKDEKISGNLIPFKKISEIEKYRGCDFLGIYITNNDLIKYGKGIITLVNSINIEGMNIYIGIELNSPSEYDENLHSQFNFVLTNYDVSSQKDGFALYSIDKFVIIKSFGTKLSHPKRTMLNKTNWIPLFQRVCEEKIVIGIRCDNPIENLHPFLLNRFKKAGGNFILYNPNDFDFGLGINLLRKALVSRKSLIHNHFRLRKSMEERNGRN